MAGAQKKRQVRERQSKKTSSSKKDNSPNDSSQGNSPKSQKSPPAGLDGNRDPAAPRSRSGSNTSNPSQRQPSGGQVVATRVLNRNVDFGAAASFLQYGVSVRDSH